MGSMKLVLVLLAAVLTVLPATSRAEVKLLMVEETWCEWCERWNEDIGVIYHKTPEGKRAPLLRADVHEALPSGISLQTRVQYTPTFVLLKDGKEVGRIEGYPGEDFFWALLNQLLDRLPTKNETTEANATGRVPKPAT